MESPCVVYRFYDSAGVLLYVGCTTQGVLRWTSHSAEQPWWPEVVHVSVAHYPSIERGYEVELEAIRTEHPRHNVVHADHKPPNPKRTLRSWGSGSIFRRSRDGRWVATVSRDGRRPTRSAATREAAEALLREMLAA